MSSKLSPFYENTCGVGKDGSVEDAKTEIELHKIP